MDAYDPSEVIDKIGGTVAVARICDVSSQAVSKWRRSGIPSARFQLLKVLHPLAFTELDTHLRSATPEGARP